MCLVVPKSVAKFGSRFTAAERSTLFSGSTLPCGIKDMSQQYSLSLSLSLFILTAIFPGGSGLASIRMSPIWILLELRLVEVVVTTGVISQIVTTNKPTPNFSQAGCPSCRPSNSVRTLKGRSSIIICK